MTKEPILIIEDDKFLRELLLRKLKSNGFNVSVAIDGTEAIKKSQRRKIQNCFA